MNFARDLQETLEKHAPKGTPADLRPASLQKFMENDIATDNGPWSLTGHEPFAEILDLIDTITRKPIRDAHVALLKAEQIGATTSLGLGPALHHVADLGLNAGYFLPTDNFARRIGRTRLKTIVRRSARLSALMRDARGASEMGDLPVNQATIKEFDGKFLYVIGMESMLGVISTPLDILLNDEVDKLPAENKEWAVGRIAHSKVRATIDFSAGYTPGAGIDLLYQEGTQHKWLVDCSTRRCLKAICLEEAFPECIGPNPAPLGDRFYRVCPKCKSQLDIVRNGRWVATYPQRTKEKKWSFRISALAIGAMSADHIMARWANCRTKSQKAKFNCSVLALPDAGAMQPFNDTTLGMMQSGEVTHLQRGRGELPRYAGVDAGNECHIIIHERPLSGKPRLVFAAEFDSDKTVDAVSEFIREFGIVSLVMDKKPLTNTARALAYRFPRIVSLQDFTTGSPLKVVDEEHEGKAYRCVKVDRNDSIDEMASEFTSEKFLRIPYIDRPDSAPVLATVATQLKNLRKDRTLDAKGRTIDTYVKAVANHFGMALNSAYIAEQIAPKWSAFEFYAVDSPEHGGDFEERNWRGAVT